MIVSMVSIAFLAGSTANLPTDFKAADGRRHATALTAALTAVHATLGIMLLANAIPRLLDCEPPTT